MEVGLHEGDLDEERRVLAAQFCIEAGADESQIPRRIEEGRCRARDIVQARRRALRGDDQVGRSPGRLSCRDGSRLEGSQQLLRSHRGVGADRGGQPEDFKRVIRMRSCGREREARGLRDRRGWLTMIYLAAVVHEHGWSE
jgi:hypothetical protein